nr:hypothetical protein [Mucilaginibacter sp. X4EP1]
MAPEIAYLLTDPGAIIHGSFRGTNDDQPDF